MTNEVKIGKVVIGGKNRPAVQSMLNVKTDDVKAVVSQIKALQEAGCEIVRFAIPDETAAKAVYEIRKKTEMPLVADIHFDYKLALLCVDAGVDKIRINPGNIGSEEKVKAVAKKCFEHKVPIRIGVNGGSLEKEILAKYGAPTADALCESAKNHIDLLNKFDFDNIVISLKSSDVKTTVEAYRKMSKLYNYPLHLGVTEAGSERMGIIKSAAAFGGLLLDGIGDTLRVSLTADPVLEVKAGFDILKAVGAYKEGIEIISCPTCGRCNINLFKLVNTLEKELTGIKKHLKVAVMGCAVNGPGEAREADIGIAGGNGVGLLFKKGEIVRKIPEDKLHSELIKEIKKMV